MALVIRKIVDFYFYLNDEVSGEKKFLELLATHSHFQIIPMIDVNEQ